MKRLFFILPTLLILINARAQQATLSWSPEIELKKKESISDIIHADNSGIYYTTVERKGGMFGAYKPSSFKSIEKLSANFSPVFSKAFTAFDEDYEIQDFYYTKNHFLIFLSKHFKKEDQTKYYVANMDMNGNVNGNAKEYFTADKDQFAEAATLSISYTPDSSGFLILAERGLSVSFGYKALREYNKNKKEEQKVVLIEIDNTGKKRWQKTIQMEDKEDRSVDIVQSAINSKGDAFFLIKEFKSNKQKTTIKDENGKKVPGYSYYVLKISNKGETVKKFNVEMGNLYINSADLKINKASDNAIISGFYNDQDNEVLKGLFYFEIDQNSAVVKKNNKDFPDEFIQEFKKHGETKKDKKNNENNDLGLSKGFTVDAILPREDGGAYLTSEYYYSKTVCTTSSNGSTHCTTYYYHHDILVVNISPDGKIEWYHRIPKRQVEINMNRYSSYVSTVYDNNLYLIFNDNPKNMDNDDDEKSTTTSRFKQAICVLVKIDPSKNNSKKELFKNDEVEKILAPYKSRILADNIIVLFTDKYRDNDPKLGKLIIEK